MNQCKVSPIKYRGKQYIKIMYFFEEYCTGVSLFEDTGRAYVDFDLSKLSPHEKEHILAGVFDVPCLERHRKSAKGYLALRMQYVKKMVEKEMALLQHELLHLYDIGGHYLVLYRTGSYIRLAEIEIVSYVLPIRLQEVPLEIIGLFYSHYRTDVIKYSDYLQFGEGCFVALKVLNEREIAIVAELKQNQLTQTLHVQLSFGYKNNAPIQPTEMEIAAVSRDFIRWIEIEAT